MKFGIKKKIFLRALPKDLKTIEAKREADKKEDEFFEKNMQEREYRVSER